MRFSLRGLLLAMAYAALVAAAIGSRNDLLAHAAWLVTLLAIFYAVVTAIVATGIERARASGFAVLAAANIAGLYFFPDRMATYQFFTALGYDGVTTRGVYVVTETRSDPLSTRLHRQTVYVSGSRAVVTAANAGCTMIAGWIGFALAALAYNQSKRE